MFVTAADLEEIRPDIMNYGVSDWTEKIFKAETRVFRTLEARWYRENASDFGVDPQTYPFDPEMLQDPDQVKLLISYKALENIYRYLMKDSPSADPFERQSNGFHELYKEELSSVLAAGLDYEWGTSIETEYSERMVPRKRRLLRG